tara:strand:- start:811 stop:1443 length:633 start_codon:yes stop_codon:yes gene_type:complete
MEQMQLQKSTAWSLIIGPLGVMILLMAFGFGTGLFSTEEQPEHAQKMMDNYDLARVVFSLIGMSMLLLIFGWISFSRQIDPDDAAMNYGRLLLLPGTILIVAGMGLWLGLGTEVEVGINVTLDHVSDGISTLGDVFLDVGILIIAIVAIRKNTITTLVKVLLALVALGQILDLVAVVGGIGVDTLDFLGWIIFTLATAGIGIQSLVAKES